MKLYLPIALALCIFALPSCGDDLCSRASDKMMECNEFFVENALCWAIRSCPECKTEIRAYAQCIVDTDSCAELYNSCEAENMEWYSCMDLNDC